jgi:hypothetical protein
MRSAVDQSGCGERITYNPITNYSTVWKADSMQVE